MLLTVTCSSTVHTERIVMFMLQEWLSELYVLRILPVIFNLIPVTIVTFSKSVSK